MSLLKKMKEKVNSNKGGFTQDESVFPFWNVDFGETTTIRLLPRIDEVSGLIWTEKHTVPMAFVDPENDSKLLNFYAPSMRNYGEPCAVIKAVSQLYNAADEAKNGGDVAKEEELRAVAGKHWVKSLFYYQGFIIDTKLMEKNTPENPIRVFPVSKKLHNKIKADIFGMESTDEGLFDQLPSGEFSIEDVEMLANGDEVDMDLFNGYNLILKKAKQGEYADWTSSSTWARKETDLTEDQIGALLEYGFNDTSKKLPEKPTAEQQAVYEEMVQVSIDRLLNGGDGFWNPEWEEAGIRKPNTKNAQTVDTTPTKTSAPAKKTTVSSDVADKIKKRGRKVAEAKEEVADAPETAEVAANDDADEAPVKRVSLKDRLKAKKEAEAA